MSFLDSLVHCASNRTGCAQSRGYLARQCDCRFPTMMTWPPVGIAVDAPSGRLKEADKHPPQWAPTPTVPAIPAICIIFQHLARFFAHSANRLIITDRRKLRESQLAIDLIAEPNSNNVAACRRQMQELRRTRTLVSCLFSESQDDPTCIAQLTPFFTALYGVVRIEFKRLVRGQGRHALLCPSFQAFGCVLYSMPGKLFPILVLQPKLENNIADS